MTTEKKNEKNKDIKNESPLPKSNTSKPKADPEIDPKEELTKLSEQLDSEKDRVLRISAEFENYKKRKEREFDDFKKFANETLFKSLLTVVDNLERAIAAAEENPGEESLLEGVKLTHKDILKLFETFNVKPVEAHHQPFDPNFHQAVTQEETDEFPVNTVTTVLQKGYLLHDRLIRPAMVVVSKKAEKEETEKTK